MLENIRIVLPELIRIGIPILNGGAGQTGSSNNGEPCCCWCC